MKALINWLAESNRYKHLLGGAAVGLLADSLWCAALAGGGIGAAMEFKDRQWGGRWDWLDLGCTAAGTAAGYGLRLLTLILLTLILVGI